MPIRVSLKARMRKECADVYMRKNKYLQTQLDRTDLSEDEIRRIWREIDLNTHRMESTKNTLPGWVRRKKKLDALAIRQALNDVIQKPDEGE